MRSKPPAVLVLVFDVFGTVVDWRGSLVREGRKLGRAKGLKVDWEAFADAWRAGYRPAMARVRSGELPWRTIDALHRMILDELLKQFGIEGLGEEEVQQLNRAWHRLRPWPDARAGLSRLKRDHVIATLSNGNVALLTALSKFGALPWDCILSAELFRHYKPDAQVYLGAAALLDVPPRRLMMVAAHKDDLHAAKACGLRTAYVRRPLEFGRRARQDLKDEPAFDVNADDFLDLARKLARGR